MESVGPASPEPPSALEEDEPRAEDARAGADCRTAVHLWRLGALERAGYAHEHAELLAEDVLIDLHRACDLLARGCPERVAFRILS